MDLTLDPTLADGYKSASQKARVVTEAWAERELYCPACPAPTLTAHRANRKVEDFHCTDCARRTQLKAKSGRIGGKVANSAYAPKMAAIAANQAPDYVFLSYDRAEWVVTDAFVVPGHFITPQVVEKRAPLRRGARRAGWEGSNIVLSEIPRAGRIVLVEAGEVRGVREVREAFRRTAFLREMDAERRGWLADVLACVERLGVSAGETFHLRDLYGFEDWLAARHPGNQHVRAKVRQQAQVLRDQGVLEFVDGKGQYELR